MLTPQFYSFSALTLVGWTAGRASDLEKPAAEEIPVDSP